MQAIVTMVERKSKFTILRKVKHRTAEAVTQVTISALKLISDHVHSITADNGTEFAHHEKISQGLEDLVSFHQDSGPTSN